MIRTSANAWVPMLERQRLRNIHGSTTPHGYCRDLAVKDFSKCGKQQVELVMGYPAMHTTDPNVLSPVAHPPGGWRSWLKALVSSDFVHKVSETFATQLLLIVIGFATTVAVARSLGPSGRGIYATMVAIGALGVQFANLGLHVSNTYYVAKNRTLLS